MNRTMKTLLVYYSIHEDARALCEQSRRAGEIDVIELREKYDRGVLSACTAGAYQAVCGASSQIDEIQVDLNEYDTVIVASPVWALNPAPAVNAFLQSADLRGREVIGLLFHGSKRADHAADVLRKRVSLAGGTCRSVVSVPLKQLKKKACDIVTYAKKTPHTSPALA